MGDFRLYQFIYSSLALQAKRQHLFTEGVRDMKNKVVMLCIATVVVLAVAGCQDKKEESQAVVTEQAQETEAPEETIAEEKEKTTSDKAAKSETQAAKKTKKKKTKQKKEEPQETAEAEETVAEETTEAEEQAQAEAEAQAKAQAEAEAQAKAQAEQARIEEEQRAAEQARIAEEEARRLAEEQAVIQQDIPQSTVAATPEQDTKTTALSYVGRSMDELIAAIGEPQEEAGRMPSCNGPGEDAAYNYPGFVVTTYEENGSRTVMSVE